MNGKRTKTVGYNRSTTKKIQEEDDEEELKMLSKSEGEYKTA